MEIVTPNNNIRLYGFREVIISRRSKKKKKMLVSFWLIWLFPFRCTLLPARRGILPNWLYILPNLLHFLLDLYLQWNAPWCPLFSFCHRPNCDTIWEYMRLNWILSESTFFLSRIGTTAFKMRLKFMYCRSSTTYAGLNVFFWSVDLLLSSCERFFSEWTLTCTCNFIILLQC